MNRILPGLALLLLLGGAGLGVAMATVNELQELSQRLISGLATPQPEMTSALERLRAALELLVISLGSGFGLLGVGLWMRRAVLRERTDRQERLIRLIQESNTAHSADIARLEALLVTQAEQTRHLGTEIAAIKEQALREESQQPRHAPPDPILSPLANALVPLAQASFSCHIPPPLAPRLALGAPEALHDQQDEEFEPF
ncbi:MAG: hypothetical protein HQL95_06740 [Magnetococcales bacterium]|nr:hypothetical protein [Magnetococcales bacterium]